MKTNTSSVPQSVGASSHNRYHDEDDDKNSSKSSQHLGGCPTNSNNNNNRSPSPTTADNNPNKMKSLLTPPITSSSQMFDPPGDTSTTSPTTNMPPTHSSSSSSCHSSPQMTTTASILLDNHFRNANYLISRSHSHRSSHIFNDERENPLDLSTTTPTTSRRYLKQSQTYLTSCSFPEPSSTATPNLFSFDMNKDSGVSSGPAHQAFEVGDCSKMFHDYQQSFSLKRNSFNVPTNDTTIMNSEPTTTYSYIPAADNSREYLLPKNHSQRGSGRPTSSSSSGDEMFSHFLPSTHLGLNQKEHSLREKVISNNEWALPSPACPVVVPPSIHHNVPSSYHDEYCFNQTRLHPSGLSCIVPRAPTTQDVPVERQIDSINRQRVNFFRSSFSPVQHPLSMPASNGRSPPHKSTSSASSESYECSATDIYHGVPISVVGSEAHGPPGANVFVFHIPNDWTDLHLAQRFSRIGPIVSARIASDKTTGRQLGFGFVSYKNVESACMAVKVLNGFYALGKRLKVTIKRGEQHFAAAHIATQNKLLSTELSASFSRDEGFRFPTHDPTLSTTRDTSSGDAMSSSPHNVSSSHYLKSAQYPASMSDHQHPHHQHMRSGVSDQQMYAFTGTDSGSCNNKGLGAPYFLYDHCQSSDMSPFMTDSSDLGSDIKVPGARSCEVRLSGSSIEMHPQVKNNSSSSDSMSLNVVGVSQQPPHGQRFDRHHHHHHPQLYPNTTAGPSIYCSCGKLRPPEQQQSSSPPSLTLNQPPGEFRLDHLVASRRQQYPSEPPGIDTRSRKSVGIPCQDPECLTTMSSPAHFSHCASLSPRLLENSLSAEPLESEDTTLHPQAGERHPSSASSSRINKWLDMWIYQESKSMPQLDKGDNQFPSSPTSSYRHISSPQPERDYPSKGEEGNDRGQ